MFTLQLERGSGDRLPASPARRGAGSAISSTAESKCGAWRGGRLMGQTISDNQGRSPPPADGAESRLRAKQVEVLYDQAAVALSATFAAAVILVGVLWSVTPHLRLLGWLLAYLLTTLLRIALIFRYRQATADERNHPKWLYWSSAGIAASGLIWGATIPLLPPPGSVLYQGFTTLWVCGLAAGSVAALSAVQGAFLAFLLPATLPGAAFLLSQGTPADVTVGGGLLMFAAFLSLNAAQMRRTVMNNLRLQFENGDLVTALAAEKQRIEELNADLESRVAERTEDLHAATEAKARCLSVASHDLRQPLQMLSLLQTSLAITVRDPDSRKIVDDMGEGLRVTAGMLDTLADFSQLDRGGIEPQITDFPIAEVFDRLRTQLDPSAQGKGLQLRMVPTQAVVRSDRALLERMLANLASNAVNYTTAGKVLVGGRRRGASFRIEVWDTGIGIPVDETGRIFQEFYQVANTGRECGKGQGLGLAIVERTARLLGHPISVRSTPGKGSVFAVEVPLVGLAARRAAPAENADNATMNASVLLVDDDEDMLNATRLLLGLRGFRVATGHTGAEALEQCERDGQWPDLVIVDYCLPNAETGMGVVRQMRASAGRDIPALILTGDASAESERVVSAHGCRLLRKPVDAAELIGSILALTTSQRSMP